MELTARELKAIVSNTTLNDYMRSCIGSALCRCIYDSANSKEDYPDEYSCLYDASFYNKPNDNDILLCFDYIEEVLGYDLNDYTLQVSL